MISDSIENMKDLLHAQICYHFFITPIPFPIPKEYRKFAERACEFLETKRSEALHFQTPRHHVIHRFAQKKNPQAKKILITHGWVSRAAFMAQFINALHQQGFDVYALDFPAHGESQGAQLPWIDAVAVLRQTINQLGPFYSVIGHSFGGSMILNTLNLANQFPAWRLETLPEKVVLLASPTCMRTPVHRLARQLKLSAKGYLLLRQVFREQTNIDLKCLQFRRYTLHAETPFLCVHGEDDDAITPNESIRFCQHYSYATLALLPGVDHLSILIDKKAEEAVCQYLT